MSLNYFAAFQEAQSTSCLLWTGSKEWWRWNPGGTRKFNRCQNGEFLNYINNILHRITIIINTFFSDWHYMLLSVLITHSLIALPYSAEMSKMMPHLDVFIIHLSAVARLMTTRITTLTISELCFPLVTLGIQQCDNWMADIFTHW